MKKRTTAKKAMALLLVCAFAWSGVSCTMLATDSDKDMKQVIANVDITAEKDFKEGAYKDYASVVKTMNGKIYKRDLIASFVNNSNSSSYVQYYGYKYTFNMLMDSLVERKLMAQYAVAYYLAGEHIVGEGTNEYSVSGYNDYVAAQKSAFTDETEKKLTLAHPEILTMKYFLTVGGTDSEEYDKVVYGLKKSVNDALDDAEKGYIEVKTEDPAEVFGDERALPSGATETDDDYYFKPTNSEEYQIYTGHNTPDSCPDYERVDGSTKMTRRKAYNDFLTTLSANGLISRKDSTTDFTKMDYYYVELASILEQAMISKMGKTLEEQAEKALTQSYVETKYAELLAAQKDSYGEDASAFETAIGSLADDKFVLYSPKGGFGFVYNILIPFSEMDNQTLLEYTGGTALNAYTDGSKEFYEKRAELLQNVKAKDLRSAWFSNDEDVNHGFAVGDSGLEVYGGRQYLFFEDNLKNGGEGNKYQEIKSYAGKYGYNGSVNKDLDGNFVSFVPTKLAIDDFIAEIEGYINFVAGDTVASGNKYASYVSDGNYTITQGKYDYSEFMYYTGSVAGVSSVPRADYFKKDSLSNKALSAVNELMFAYSTDTVCFNTYFGYAVSPTTNQYMPEFQYAARYALSQGEGTYVVCPTNYGWHILYVSVSYGDKADVYEGITWQDVEDEVEGSFSYMFFDSLKQSTLQEKTTKVETDVLGKYENGTTVHYFKSRYKDLLEMGK